ncbi:MAG: transposase [Patescibacteria group bacterium]
MNDIFDMPDEWKIAGHDEVVGMPTEDKGLIITGLGGDDKQFRYFVAISASKHSVLKSSFKTKVKKTLGSLFSQAEVKLEKITIKPDHIRLMLLVGMNSSVNEIIMPFIRKVNANSSQLFKHYFAVNTNVPEDKEIQNYVDQIRKS